MSRLCAMWARGHCNRGSRCQDRHYTSPDERIPCDCPEKSDAYPGGERYSHRTRLHEIPPGDSLLGSARNFCAAFYHVKETPEAGAVESCLRTGATGGTLGSKCSGKSVVALARLSRNKIHATDEVDNWEDVYVARYMNCSSGALCAESTFIEDEDLKHCVRQHARSPIRLILYLNTQPCHYSTDTRPRWSCTESLVKYQADVLSPYGVRLEVVAAYPYRCHWDQGSVPQRLVSKIDNARAGTALILKAAPHVLLRAFMESDWRYVLGMCDATLQQDYDGDQVVFAAHRKAARKHMDAFAQACFSDKAPWLTMQGAQKGGEVAAMREVGGMSADRLGGHGGWRQEGERRTQGFLKDGVPQQQQQQRGQQYHGAVDRSEYAGGGMHARQRADVERVHDEARGRMEDQAFSRGDPKHVSEQHTQALHAQKHYSNQQQQEQQQHKQQQQHQQLRPQHVQEHRQQQQVQQRVQGSVQGDSDDSEEILLTSDECGAFDAKRQCLGQANE